MTKTLAAILAAVALTVPAAAQQDMRQGPSGFRDRDDMTRSYRHNDDTRFRDRDRGFDRNRSARARDRDFDRGRRSDRDFEGRGHAYGRGTRDRDDYGGFREGSRSARNRGGGGFGGSYSNTR
jgi:Ni/Co efflux regulator RcnB